MTALLTAPPGLHKDCKNEGAQDAHEHHVPGHRDSCIGLADPGEMIKGQAKEPDIIRCGKRAVGVVIAERDHDGAECNTHDDAGNDCEG